MLYCSLEKMHHLLAIDTLKNTFSPGPDDIPAYILKSCKLSLVPQLTEIFNISIKEGTYPESWKLCNIIPVFKKGAKNEITNYRPISIMNACVKVF